MKQTILIFNIMHTGHWSEYIRHILEIAEADKSFHNWIFAIPQQMSEALHDVCHAENIRIEYIPETTINRIGSYRGFKLAYKSTKLLKIYCKRFSPDKIFLPHFTLFIPSIMFMISGKAKVSGIIYKMFLYKKEVSISSRLKRFIEWSRFFLAARSKRIDTIFLLNNPHSAQVLNTRLHTDKFAPLSDPYIPISDVYDIRAKYRIGRDTPLFVHLGPTARKGTMQILDAIELTQSGKQAFFFAGQINNDIRDVFLKKVESLKKNGHVIFVKDEFCSYEFFGSLVYSSDCVLLPYFTTDTSSGFLGYAAQFGKPVIGPSDGLLGDLIREYKLGITISPISGTTIASAVQSMCFDGNSRSLEYLERNSLSAFKNSIRSVLLKESIQN